VVADADVWTEGIPSAIRALVCGAAEWTIPHRRVLRLSKASTEQLLATGQPGDELARRAYDGRLGGGIVIARRETLLEVPMDGRFIGWGEEDTSWGIALATICGHPWRGTEDLLHLWHPPQERMSPRRGSVEGWNLYRRYMDARGKPDEMRELMKGAR